MKGATGGTATGVACSTNECGIPNREIYAQIIFRG